MTAPSPRWQLRSRIALRTLHRRPITTSGRITEFSTREKELDRIAALVPPPRVHRHRYHGVLAPNSPLRDQVTALVREVAADATRDAQASDADQTDADEHVLRSPARYLWATLIARLFEICPLTWYSRISAQA